MRRTLCAVTFAILTGLALAPLHGDDLSRSIRTSRRQNTDRASETIPAPQPARVECPTLEQLGYRTKQLSELSLDVRMHGERLPADCSERVFQGIARGEDPRSWLTAEFNWAASDLFAQPAYFDDPVLERYGQTYGPLVQPWLSGAHFFGQFPLMPYKLLVDRPFEQVYILGYDRPGSPTPCVGRRAPRR